MSKYNYPFSAVLGQEKLKTALILNIINPRIGGVLITGEKGTAKSTIVRALANLTNRRVITLPLSITEDRLIGSIDIEKTMYTGTASFLPGILSEANGQILYIDEVNLLPEHITDIVLCALAEKKHTVEREGISTNYLCDFSLVGTMNPEEGQLRTHFLDRFGLCVVIQAENKPEDRMGIVKLRAAYEDNPREFNDKYKETDIFIKEKIKQAQEILPFIEVSEENRLYIVKKCLEAQVQGHRADKILEETTKALAACKGFLKITSELIDEAAPYVLIHRRKNSESIQEKENTETHSTENTENNAEEHSEHRTDSSSEHSKSSRTQRNGHGKEQTYSTGSSYKVVDFGHSFSRQVQKGVGKRTKAKSADRMGRYIYAAQQHLTGDLALDATIRAAAPYQNRREKNGLSIAIRESDIREKVRQKKYSNLLVFVVDASGSMGASKRMTETKGAILSLLKDAYVKRDKICLIVFKGTDAQVLLPPTRSIERGVKLLDEMPVGGKTPLNYGIAKSIQVIQSELKKNPGILPYMILITDGKGNVSIDKDRKPKEELMEISDKLRSFTYLNKMVLDIEKKGAMSFGIAKEMAIRMHADYEKIETLKSNTIINAIERIR